MTANYSAEEDMEYFDDLKEFDKSAALTESLARINGYRVYIQHDNKLLESFAYFTSMNPESLSATHFNFLQDKGVMPTDKSVIIDTATARNLGIEVGDTIEIIQRDSDYKASFTITDTVRDYAPTIGIICSDSFEQPGSLDSIQLFFDEEPPDILENSLIYDKNLLLDDARVKAQEAFPAFLSNIINIATLIFCFALSFAFYAIVFRSERKDFFIPMMCMGSKRSTLLTGYCLPALAILLCATSIGLGIACAFLYSQYDLVLFIEEIVAALTMFTGLSWLGAISAAITFLRK